MKTYLNPFTPFIHTHLQETEYSHQEFAQKLIRFGKIDTQI